MAQDVTITQVKSTIGQSARHRAALRTLGLGRIGKTVVKPSSDSLSGQLRLVAHLVRVESTDGKEG